MQILELPERNKLSVFSIIISIDIELVKKTLKKYLSDN
jgi:hypothetical protein